MRAGIVKLAAVTGLGTLGLLAPAPADPSDDLAGPAADTAKGGGEAQPDFNDVEIVDPALQSKLELIRIGSHRGSNNLLTVFTVIKNKTARKVELEIETIYKDHDGNALNTGSWIGISLEPQKERNYRSSAISEAAVDFLIRVRRAHDPAATH